MCELILLVAQASEGDTPFGATKLNKLLFYIDFAAFLRSGNAVTWQPYQRLPNGPAPRRLLYIVKKMEANHDCSTAKSKRYGKTTIKLVALRDPELSGFAPEEVQLAHDIIGRYWGRTAREMSDLSHRFSGWRLAKDRELIPYSSVLIRRGPKSDAAEKHAATLVDRVKRFRGRKLLEG
jgi:hypothetical protein